MESTHKKNFVNIETMTMLYHALFNRLATYGIEVWISANANALMKLQDRIVQKVIERERR